MIDQAFVRALSTLDIDTLSLYAHDDLKSALPLLTRCCLCSPTDQTMFWKMKRHRLMTILLEFPEVNPLIELLNTEFDQVVTDSTSQLQLRMKQSNYGATMKQAESMLVEFDSYSPTMQFKCVVTELRWLISQKDGNIMNVPLLLDSTLYRDAITNLLCIALNELPMILSIIDVIEVLLHLNSGVHMAIRICLNSPWSIDEVGKSLVMKSRDTDGDKLKSNREQLIKALCKLSGTTAQFVAQTCSDEGKLPQLLAWLYFGMDDVTTVTQLAEFISTHKRLAKSLLQNRTSGAAEESSYMTQFRQTLLSELDAITTSSELAMIDHSRASILIRVYACLRETVAYKFTDQESEKMFKLFLSLPLNTDRDMRLVIQAICLVIASIQQLSNYSQQISAWLKSLARNTKLYTQSSESSVGQFLLLVAIHYHGNQLSTISEMVASHLSVKPSTVKLANTILKQIVTYDVFTEQVVSQLTVLLSVTKNLNADMKGYLPIHCVCQLLKSRAFSKHNVNISDWILNQLCNISFPIHPMVSQMISLYILSTMPQQHNLRSANPQLDEAKIKDYFTLQSSNDNLASKLALVCYVLTHQESINAELATVGIKKKSVCPYSSELLAVIPVNMLVTKAYHFRSQCGSLYPTLVKLMYNNMPYLCSAEMWLPDLNKYRKPNRLLQNFEHISHEKVAKNSIHKQYLKLRLAAEKLSDDTISVLLDTIRLVQSTDDELIPRHMTIVLLETWNAMSKLQPEKLFIGTVNILRGSYSNLTEEQVVSDPLLVLQCLPSCRQPDILSILLHLISVYTKASNQFYHLHSQTKTAKTPSVAPSDAAEICYSLLAAQESATVQILLEQCLPESDQDASGDTLSNHREIQTLICSHIHKLIMDDPNLAKLVCFQGYDERLIPVAISGIPSLHICLDYIPELLAQPDIYKQVFAVRLTAALCKQYGIHKTFGMAKLCINTLVTLIGVLPVQETVTHILPVLTDVVSMCQHMPVLYEDWIYLLSKVIPVLSAIRGQIMIPNHKGKQLTLSCS